MSFPQDFTFETATSAMARARAGRHGPIPPRRSEGFRHVDDRPHVSVSWKTSRVPFPVIPWASSICIAGSEMSLFYVNCIPNMGRRYEAILLAPGENKIDVEVDTRECSTVYRYQP